MTTDYFMDLIWIISCFEFLINSFKSIIVGGWKTYILL